MAEASTALTVADALSWATGQLAGAGCDTPRLDAELLVAAALGVDRARLVLDAKRQVDPEPLRTLVSRRADREPIAYIVGRKPFRKIVLSVDRRALIPRPETELLVEVGLGLEHGARVLDVGTGSGAVALALKAERPDLDVSGVDLSAGAVQLACENARSLALEVEFAVEDLLGGEGRELDAVLANLPYVEDDAELAPEIQNYEPPGALFAGRDGLAVIRRLVAQAAGVPLVGLEVGSGQADAVEQLLHGGGFHSVERLRDLAGHERVLVGRRA